jgi:hypothetical protein
MDEWGIGMAKSKAAPSVSYAKKLGAKDKDEIQFVEEYLDNIQTTSPEKFREMYGSVKTVNMDINTAIERKLENFFKKKHKWDDSKGIDGGLDDIAYEKYDDELYQAQAQFGQLSRRKTGPGMFDEEGWGNHPNNYLEEAGNRFESITGEKLNVDFWKNYTDDVLNKYKVEKFNQGGRVGLRFGSIPKILEYGPQVVGGVTDLAVRLARGFMKMTGRRPNKDEVQKIIREAAEKDLENAISGVNTPGLRSKDEYAMNVGGGYKAIERRIENTNKDVLMKEIEKFNIPVRTQEPFDFASGGRVQMAKGGLIDILKL